MDTDSFIVHVKTEDICKHIAKMLRKDLALQILNQTDQFLEEKNKKVTGLMKGELGRQIMNKFFGLRAKTYSYLKDNNNEDKKKQKA